MNLEVRALKAQVEGGAQASWPRDRPPLAGARGFGSLFVALAEVFCGLG